MNFEIAHVGAGFAPYIEAHLRRLSPTDRSLRFASAVVSDQTISAYVASIHHGLDIVVVLIDGAGTVVGFAHGCRYQVMSATNVEAAFSVDVSVRGQGLGRSLMRAVMQQARATRVTMVVGSCAARNLPMRRIFECEDMSIDREGGELYAHIAIEQAAEAGRSANAANASLLRAVEGGG